MKLSEFKKIISNQSQLQFSLPNGQLIPQHFHVTEVGSIAKHFIDCGGTVREEHVVNFQLWYSDDTEHRLDPSKLKDIIILSEEKLGLSDSEVEVEYQSATIGKYGLDYVNNTFVLVAKQTDCLAKENCGIPIANESFMLNDMVANTEKCTPGSGCC